MYATNQFEGKHWANDTHKAVTAVLRKELWPLVPANSPQLIMLSSWQVERREIKKEDAAREVLACGLLPSVSVLICACCRRIHFLWQAFSLASSGTAEMCGPPFALTVLGFCRYCCCWAAHRGFLPWICLPYVRPYKRSAAAHTQEEERYNYCGLRHWRWKKSKPYLRK